MLDTTLLLAFSFTSLLTTIPGVVAQCPQTAGYLGAFDSFTGDFIGAVSRNFPPPIAVSGTFTLDRTSNTSNYLAVFPFTNSTNEGDAALLQILNPGDPNAPFVSLVIGIADCTRNAFSNALTSFAIIAASDGFPHGALPIPGTTRTTFNGGYGNLGTFCGEPMALLVRSAFGRNVLAPVWTDPNGSQHPLFFVQDLTRDFLAATPDPDVYASSNNVVVQEVNLAIFI
ncbi:hypothetical protein C8F04DRAFT_1144256 [Mycena alexandri]|uniref:Uncharacterized protein n=1 Tax=Mycena alexandri TaxID=1745969 RepID=A0AAD6S507_9AGAR|nr:hypothetical protein C8F04DRAFT_1144256 [Mycena alexandri]